MIISWDKTGEDGKSKLFKVIEYVFFLNFYLKKECKFSIWKWLFSRI